MNTMSTMPFPSMAVATSMMIPEMIKTMPVQQPAELYDRFAMAFNGGDLEAVMALFDADGQTVPFPGQPPVMGLPAIRAVMQQALAFRPQLHYESMDILQTEDVALLRSQWRLTIRLPDSYPQERTGKGIQVVRRQPDGSWRLLIDNPWAE